MNHIYEIETPRSWTVSATYKTVCFIERSIKATVPHCVKRFVDEMIDAAVAPEVFKNFRAG